MTDDGCPMCLLAPKTSKHILWESISAIDILGQCSKKIQKSKTTCQNMKELIAKMIKRLQQDEMEELALTLWNIWRRRNENVFNNVLIDPKTVLHRVLQMQHELAVNKANTDTQIQSNATRNGTWKFPPSGFCKFNWDVAIDRLQYKIDIGIAVRDEEGNYWLP
ncbi:uncharacterized protein LOC121249389 [Juglans microcarpa x Juglans regia]|uniref:uncharacterized protein LOC121249389 n=1 Tax=Juglans microcarpa x Juglans regia TaxID=2249226 RepID=UPI001B7EEFFD|nr:uncharacterized protein LOC121249389 [Juglans microcarpa x Juglans regia]